MQWHKITVETNAWGEDILTEVMMQHGAKGTEIHNREDWLHDENQPDMGEILDATAFAALPETVTVTGFWSDEPPCTFHDALQLLTIENIGFDIGSLAVTRSTVEEEDWAESWKQYFKPIRVGKRLVICPVWEMYDQEPDDLVIRMDPGMAFGNGSHETTALCLTLLEEWVQAGDIVLDVGTGSGILAIAALKLGASRALAVDLDPLAVRVARENVQENDLTERIVVEERNLADGLSMRANILISNIIADVLVGFAPNVSQHLVPGGLWIASGIIQDRANDVIRAMEANGFTVERDVRQGEWVALAARHG